MTISILNISNTYRAAFSTKNYAGFSKLPPYVNLGPGQTAAVNNEDLEAWPPSAKSELAGYIQAGILQASELTDVHTVRDYGHTLPKFGANSLDTAITAAVAFKNVYNMHASNGGVHVAADTVNQVALADPTDLPELLLYIGGAGGLQLVYNAHIAVAPAVHPTADAVNATTLTAIDLPTAIEALRELYGLFNQHKIQFSAVATASLTPPQVMSYTAP